ncbi:MAG TPA: DUF1345 domain-containing protein, partial [Ramlibacter sp.]|nr:DUF1345 domain-containing protein [Ramlibacter sp.]
MALLAWNAACLVYLLLCWRTTQSVPVDVIRSRAVIEDEGRMTILLLVVIGAAAVLLAVGSQLGHA